MTDNIIGNHSTVTVTFVSEDGVLLTMSINNVLGRVLHTLVSHLSALDYQNICLVRHPQMLKIIGYGVHGMLIA